MLSCSEIKADLKEIRNYYQTKEAFGLARDSAEPHDLLGKISRYSSVITNAPAKLFIVYYSLYVENKTHEYLAKKWGYSISRIAHLSEDVVFFLQRNLA